MPFNITIRGMEIAKTDDKTTDVIKIPLAFL